VVYELRAECRCIEDSLACRVVDAALPALTAISGLLILRERLGPRTIIGLVLATGGVVIVAGSGLSLDLGVVLCLIG
jgi:drug/metabolite transporter (DMT)-like permease